MPNYLDYRKSISNELTSIKDRVRNFIDDHHWAEDGRYKEVILRSILMKQLPNNVTVGTGFVVDEQQRASTQIDIIVYRNDIPPLFVLDDFVVVPKESVLGIIEVKTTIRNSEMNNVVEKAHKNGMLVGEHVFNGIFGFECEFDKDTQRLPQPLETALKKSIGFVNNICFGKDIFMKYWNIGCPHGNVCAHYSFYDLQDLAFGYFISNLVEDVQTQLTGNPIMDTLKTYLYPIDGTKEVRRIDNFELNL